MKNPFYEPLSWDLATFWQLEMQLETYHRLNDTENFKKLHTFIKSKY